MFGVANGTRRTIPAGVGRRGGGDEHRGERFGFERTRAIAGKSAQEIAEAARDWGQNDDITVVPIRRIASSDVRRIASSDVRRIASSDVRRNAFSDVRRNA